MNPYYQPFPKEIENATTAWPYLRRRFPWIFNEDGEVQPEGEQARQLGQIEQDVIKFAVYMLQDKHYTLADIAEALTNKREYGGALFTRVKAVKNFLEDTTTTPESCLQADFGTEVAA
jgi:hypothetical protein